MLPGAGERADVKHRLARSLFLYGICNGWIGEGITIVEASSGSTAVSEAYFARMLRFGAGAPCGPKIGELRLDAFDVEADRSIAGEGQRHIAARVIARGPVLLRAFARPVMKSNQPKKRDRRMGRALTMAFSADSDEANQSTGTVCRIESAPPLWSLS